MHHEVPVYGHFAIKSNIEIRVYRVHVAAIS